MITTSSFKFMFAVPIVWYRWAVQVSLTRTLGHGERHRLALTREDLVVGIDQLDLDLVLTRLESGDVDRVEATRVRPPPPDIIDVYVQMPNAWRNVNRALVEDRDNAQVLHSVLDPENALAQCLRVRGVHEQFRQRLVLKRDVRIGL